MKIRQILNNNVALVKRGGTEIFVISKGIAFRRKKGEEITEAEIEKMYILDSYDKLDHFSYLLSHSDENDILLIDEIISYGEKELNIKSSDYLSLTLLDHLEFLLKRSRKRQFVKSPLIWDIKRFYPKYFDIGIHALNMICERKGIDIPEDEAVAISLHFINMQLDKEAEAATIKEMQTLSDIVSIIQHHYQIQLDENSANYMRLTTHLQYFIQRIVKNEISCSNQEPRELHQQVSELYPEAYKCIQKIKQYVKKQFNLLISISEETYLMLHIHRVTERMEEK